MKFEKFPFKIEKQYRLSGYDYSQNGYYFVTICAKDHINYFGEIKNNNVELNDIGKITQNFWLQIPKKFKNIYLDEFVIIPNHLHGIIIIKNLNRSVETHRNVDVGTHHDAFLQNNKLKINNPNYFPLIAQKSTQLLPVSIKLFKSSTKLWCNKNNSKFQWQSRFHDRIIRNEKEYFAIRQYIKNNPKNWEKDKENKFLV